MPEPEHPAYALEIPHVRSDDVRSLIMDLDGRASDNDSLSVEVDVHHRGGEVHIIDSAGFPLFTLAILGAPTPDEAAIEADEHDYQGPGE